MTIDIDDNRVRDFFAEIVAIGIRRHEETLRPSKKTINQSQAKEYLQRVGFAGSVLAKMIAARKITPIKEGNAKNSSVRFSTAQFFNAVDRMRVERFKSI